MGHRWAYAIGYKEAADAVARRILEEDNGFSDLMVYSAAFLYRQYLELALKEIEMLAAVYLREEPLAKTTHQLLPLWERLERALLANEGALSEAHKHAARVVEDWDSVDRNSFAFRYPTDKQGMPALPELPLVDLETMIGVMRRLDGYLYGVRTGFEVHLEARSEAEAE